MIFIRADGNKNIGMGHIMRCLSIAREINCRVLFLLAEEQMQEKIQQEGFETLVLGTDYQNMISEMPILQKAVDTKQKNIFLVDSYYVTEEYLLELGKIGEVYYIDDVNMFDYPVDGVINYNIYGERIPYATVVKGRKRKLLLGCSYVPIRKEFFSTPRCKDKLKKNIMITTGGSDRYNLCTVILKKILQSNMRTDIEIHVVCGKFNAHIDELKAIEKENSMVYIHINVPDMWNLMKKMDLAITAGGSTMYELCAMGIPIICFSFVDNQEKIVECFKERKLVPFAGNYMNQKLKMVDELYDSLEMMLQNEEKLDYYSEKLHELVDGRGAERIAHMLEDRNGESA